MRTKLLSTLIYLLVVILVVEGIVRKLAPGGLSQILIFAKDLVALAIAVQVMAGRRSKRVEVLRLYWMGLLVALLPLFLLTALHDPVLAVFGLKQYMLFFPVAFAIPVAFRPRRKQPREMLEWGRWMGALIVPTSALALLQIALPVSHWLNLSVAGEDMTAFSAGGFLRVSSTFPFIAQYNFFLTFAAGWVAMGMQFPGKGWRAWLLRTWVILPAYLIGLFATGSRQSVVGAFFIAAVAFGVLLISGKGAAFRRFILLGATALAALLVTQWLFPSAFGAYEARTGEGTFSEEHSEEMTDRLTHALFGWTHFAEKAEAGLFGHGLGIMSNGVQNVSSYAARMRNTYGWGEVDISNTVFEGGYYLVFVWLGFRVAVVLFCFATLKRISSKGLLIPTSLLFGFVTFNGLLGTLGVQPPLYLWWSIAVGAIILFAETETLMRRAKRRRQGQGATLSGEEGPQAGEVS
jgi:hypothetical protein